MQQKPAQMLAKCLPTAPIITIPVTPTGGCSFKRILSGNFLPSSLGQARLALWPLSQGETQGQRWKGNSQHSRAFWEVISLCENSHLGGMARKAMEIFQLPAGQTLL